MIRLPRNAPASDVRPRYRYLQLPHEAHSTGADRAGESLPSLELRVSVITLFELEYGVLRSEHRNHLRRVVRAFLENVEVLTWTASAASEAGAVRAELAAAGGAIGAYDLLIAGHARSLEATLVTNNLREFSRVSGLLLADWARDTNLPG